eukprot:542996-Prorocentrum_lima.AAC.1
MVAVTHSVGNSHHKQWCSMGEHHQQNGDGHPQPPQQSGVPWVNVTTKMVTVTHSAGERHRKMVTVTHSVGDSHHKH